MANVELGAKLKWYRKEQHMTLQQVADALGVSAASTVSSWESGKSEPSISTLSKIGVLYHIGNLYSLATNEQLPSSLTPKEETLIHAYREHPEYQEAVNRILGIQARR